MLNHRDVSVSKLAAVFPEHAQKLTPNPAVTARLEIEGDHTFITFHACPKLVSCDVCVPVYTNKYKKNLPQKVPYIQKAVVV